MGPICVFESELLLGFFSLQKSKLTITLYNHRRIDKTPMFPLVLRLGDRDLLCLLLPHIECFWRNRNTVKLYFLHWLTYLSKSEFDDWQIRSKLESELINNNSLVLF